MMTFQSYFNLIHQKLHDISCRETHFLRTQCFQNEFAVGAPPRTPLTLAGGEGAPYPSSRTPPPLSALGLALRSFGPQAAALQALHLRGGVIPSLRGSTPLCKRTERIVEDHKQSGALNNRSIYTCLSVTNCVMSFFIARCYAERGIAMASRLSVCPSVCS